MDFLDLDQLLSEARHQGRRRWSWDTLQFLSNEFQPHLSHGPLRHSFSIRRRVMRELSINRTLRTGTRAGQYTDHVFFFAGKKCCEKSRKTSSKTWCVTLGPLCKFVASLSCIPTSPIHASQRQNTTLIAVFERKGQLALLGRS